MDEKTQIRIYFFRFTAKSGAGYFGFGLTPDQAVLVARAAGINGLHHRERASIEEKGKMILLPEGTTAYGVVDYGRCIWDAPTNDYKEMQWDPKVSRWFVP